MSRIEGTDSVCQKTFLWHWLDRLCHSKV